MRFTCALPIFWHNVCRPCPTSPQRMRSLLPPGLALQTRQRHPRHRSNRRLRRLQGTHRAPAVFTLLHCRSPGPNPRTGLPLHPGNRMVLLSQRPLRLRPENRTLPRSSPRSPDRSRARRQPRRRRRPIHSRRSIRIVHNSVPITYTSGEQVEVYRFSFPVTIGITLLALFVQAFVPLRFPRFAVYFDLPLLVTIFFAMARRSPISGLLTGSVIGLAQDMLGHNPIGLYGIAKTVVGYGASSLGVKLDVENAGARFLVTLAFYLVHAAVYFTVARGMVNMTQTWSWPHGIVAGLANAFRGVLLYFLLDKFKQRT